jgi:curved DNA-binding protein CbpA
MAWKPSDRVELASSEGFNELPLTPQDFFIVSRLDAKPSVRDIASGVGLSVDEVGAKLDTLVELGVARKVKAERAKRASDAKARQASRLRKALGGVPVSHSNPPRRSKPSGTRRSGPLRSKPGDSRAPDSSLPPNSEISGHFDLAEPGSPIDPILVDSRDERLDPALEVDLERQRQVLGLSDKLDTLNHFEILGITPTNKVSDIKRAYHKLSRSLHPDAYYGKEIGPFQEILQELFEKAKDSHDLLISSEKRDAYVERLLDIERQKLATAEKKSRDREARKEQAKMLERQKIEAEKAREHAAYLEERARRDAARKRKMSSRLMGREAREVKANEHYEAGLAAVEEDNYGAAAGLFRLSMDLVPENAAYHQKWEETLAEAQSRRATVAISQAEGLVNKGEEGEAGHYYEEAARAVPSPLNQARAAFYLALRDQARAHSRAQSALQALAKEPSEEEGGIEQPVRLEVLLLCAEAYLRLGQLNTAKVHLEEARKLSPKDRRVRVLLKKLRVS